MGLGRLCRRRSSLSGEDVSELGGGARPDGSRTVASSTPVRLSNSITEAPEAIHPIVGGIERWAVEVTGRRRNAQVSAPVEIADAEHELVLECVAAIDVAKDSGTVCLRAPTTSGPRRSRVWEVAARTRSVQALAEELAGQGVQKVTVESTSDYWRMWFYLLEAAGLSVQLVNARDVKNVPGRPKTDKLDAVWLAKLTEKGLLRPSFVPPAPIRKLRDYTRMRVDLTREQTRHWQRLEKLLEDASIKVSAVASKLTTLSARDMIDHLIAGERDPLRLADLARGRMKDKRTELITALDGYFDDHHAELARILLAQIDALETHIGTLSERIEELIAGLDPPTQPQGPGGCTEASADQRSSDGAAEDARSTAQPRLSAVDRLDEIPGIAQRSAQVIIAEIGLDMAQFPTAAHLVSWAKLSPRTIQSGARTRAGRTGKGNPYLRSALGEAAASVVRTDTYLGDRYRRLVKRRGKGKALVAVARSILVIVWHLLDDPDARFSDLGSDFYAHHINVERRARVHIAQLAALGYRVNIEPVEPAAS